jgi:hypothetical protein
MGQEGLVISRQNHSIYLKYIRKIRKILIRVARCKDEIGIDHLTRRNPACRHGADGASLLGIRVLCGRFEVLCRINR